MTGGLMRSLAVAALLCLTGAAVAAGQDFNWHGRLAAGKRLEIKGVNGDVRAVLASGAEAVVNARKHGHRSDPDDAESRVVPSDDGIPICAVYPTTSRAHNEKTCEPCDNSTSKTENNYVVVVFTV